MTPTTSRFTLNWLLIGEHVVFAVSVVLDRHLLYIAAVIEMREQNLSARGQNKPTELCLSLLCFLLEKGQRERKAFWQRVCLGSFMCEDACSGGIGGGGGTAASLPSPIKTWTMSIRTVMYHTIILVWSLWNFQSRQGHNYAKLSRAVLNWGTEYAWVFYVLVFTASRHRCPCHRWERCAGSCGTV